MIIRAMLCLIGDFSVVFFRNNESCVPGQNISAKVVSDIVKELPTLIQEADLTLAQVSGIL